MLAAHVVHGIGGLDRPEERDLRVLHRLWIASRGSLHRDGGNDLHQVVDDDVPQGTDGIVEVAPVLDAEGLGHRDLHRGDVVPVPDRLEHRVRKPEEEDLLQAHLSEVVVDPQQLSLVDVLMELGGEGPGGVEVVPERLLDDDATGPDQPGLGEPLDGAAEEERRDLEVEDGVARTLDRSADTLVRLGVCKVAADVREAGREPLEHAFVEQLSRGDDRRSSALDELIDRPVVDRDSDDRAREQPSRFEPVERSKRHHSRQIAGDPEHHEDVRRLLGLSRHPSASSVATGTPALTVYPERYRCARAVEFAWDGEEEDQKKERKNGAGAEARRAASLGRLENGLRQGGDWYHWGPYLSERQWGTVREDYSANGTAWEYLPHDHARSRAYRWGEDGLAGFSDVEQLLCLGLALWNGRDPILKERIFGLTGNQGNHGEDAKEYWWYLDATPTHSWNRWRYHYPQSAFPYETLVEENAARGKQDPEFELLDTGIFDDDRYWIVEVDYAKADPHDLLLTVRVTNQGPETDTVHVLPTAWYRNTWAWDGNTEKPELRAVAGAVTTEHPFLGALELHADAGPDGSAPALLFCDNETNDERIFGTTSPAYPKDGINDHVVSGAGSVNPDRHGTKAAYWYRRRGRIRGDRRAPAAAAAGRQSESRHGRTSTR